MDHDETPHRRQRSTSRSRPTTPLRPSSRSSLRDSARNSVHGDAASFPLNTFEPAFAELSDAVADLEANMMHFQLMHESLARFSESFASFLYGLNMNAFCVDFPEGPLTESFRRMKVKEEEQQQSSATRLTERSGPEIDTEATFMTTDTSFVENPPSTKSSSRYQTPASSRQSRVPGPAASTRGTTSTRGSTRGGRGGTGTRGSRGSGLARPRGRGIR
ncbi:DASH complex subunit DAM1 [Dichotomopilus funicola]|uniref:DASH complex subunit DAM1 n=1 Tax=Dichotomopilus funicola TaxID=1934379 RepID=A0AAN6UUV1_9PEZI|nr:DASH complex subunit DAM1 [Dichotomopilus funicola]